MKNFKASPQKISSHIKFIAVEENSRNVTAGKHKDNADENEGKVDLTANRTVLPPMGKFKIFKFIMMIAIVGTTSIFGGYL